MSGCTYHIVTPISRGFRTVFRVDVFRNGTLENVYDDGECEFSGGNWVATLFRPTEDQANGAGIAYSFPVPKTRNVKRSGK